MTQTKTTKTIDHVAKRARNHHEAALKANIRRGDAYAVSRRHKCETCEVIFLCEDCTEVMEEKLMEPNPYFNCLLYADRHMPAKTNSRWLCPDCEILALEIERELRATRGAVWKKRIRAS